MKFTIATIHSSYGLSYVPDGKVVELELRSTNAPISLSNINWLRPSEDHKYIADMMFEDEIAGLERVESSLESYFIEQFDDNESRLLWMPAFHEMHLFCQHYLDGKSVFDVGNTIFSKVINDIATEVEVLVFHLGEMSLSKLGSSKSLNEKLSFRDLEVNIKGYKVTKKSKIFEELLKNYSLTLLSQKSDFVYRENINKNDVQLDQFSNYGKLESI